jgi:hypothetical protein
VDIVRAAQDKGLLKAPTTENPKPSISPLYGARDWIERSHPGKEVNEFTATTPGGTVLKHWQIVDKPTPPANPPTSPPANAPVDSDPPF